MDEFWCNWRMVVQWSIPVWNLFFFFLPFDFCLLCSLVLFCFLQLSSWVPGVLHGWAVGLNGVLVSFGYISKCIFTQQWKIKGESHYCLGGRGPFQHQKYACSLPQYIHIWRTINHKSIFCHEVVQQCI